MFKANMVAPCGLDCNICAQALIEKILVRDVMGRMIISLTFVLCTARSFYAGSG